ncbi:MAG: metallophosphoesterase family protein [Solirubrobacterales bacterium]|nr:metallophosphoesterase family protein [Solirubrobacterales bacterium]
MCASCCRRRFVRPQQRPPHSAAVLRTLVLSDLHLGARTRVDRLREPEIRATLLDAVREADTVVLLGDVLELRQGPVREALSEAGPVLAEIGQALGSGGEVVIVPGNHDHHLLDSWFQRSAREHEPPSLGTEHRLEWSAGGPLATLAAALAPVRMRASYPGVWLRGDLYATHGHYLDRHTTVPVLERIAAGAMARIVGEPEDTNWRAEDYEAILAPIYAWIHAIAQRSPRGLGSSSHGVSAQAWRRIRTAQRGRRLRGAGTAGTFAAGIRALNRTSLGPLRSDLSSSELRRAGLQAFGEVLGRLEIDADHVIFGHTHRAGPLPDDDQLDWVTAKGTRIMNVGSWIVEPLGSAAPAGSPYRPGFCAFVEDDGPPTLHNLLDGLRPSQA